MKQGSRPLSSQFNNILLMKAPQGQSSGMPLGQTRTTEENFSSKIGESEQVLRQQQVQTSPTPMTHQTRLRDPKKQMKYQQSAAEAQVRRPGTSIPKAATLFTGNQYTDQNTQQNEEDALINSNDPHGKEDFINVRQMLDPSLAADSSNRIQPNFVQPSDTDMQTTNLGDMPLSDEQRLKKRVLRRPKSTPYSYFQKQPISAMSDEKSSQNLISQLRIKSVR